jgi:hypothetical protein
VPQLRYLLVLIAEFLGKHLEAVLLLLILF